MVLASPEFWQQAYLYSALHPAARQTQVDVRAELALLEAQHANDSVANSRPAVSQFDSRRPGEHECENDRFEKAMNDSMVKDRPRPARSVAGYCHRRCLSSWVGGAEYRNRPGHDRLCES